jgi:vacuolar-type H+-ATPase subunit F/Vma7
MAAEADTERTTRMLFLGDDSLADGFRLIGFETFPNPRPEEAEKIFRDLIRNGERAFVIVDDHLMRADVPALAQLRAEGGRIIVSSVPRLKEPPRLVSDVADRLNAMFGGAVDGPS